MKINFCEESSKLKKNCGDVSGGIRERRIERLNQSVLIIGEGYPVQTVCDFLEVSRSTYYRKVNPTVYFGPPKPRPSPPNKIPLPVREKVLSVMHEERFFDATPMEVVPQLLDEGVYHACIRTYYRILAEVCETGNRRLQARKPRKEAPVLRATGPNQVWTWDITRLKGACIGEYYLLYLMIDLYSRYVVGWMVSKRENSKRAKIFLEKCIIKHVGPKAENLTIHSDNGSPMIATSTRSLLLSMDVNESFSRPRVSNDNAMSESIFKSLKYGPTFPGWFETQFDVEIFMANWVIWYNETHKHSGISLLTPESVFKGNAEEVIKKRQLVLNKAYAENPIRFPKGCPIHPKIPEFAGINLIMEEKKQEQLLKREEETTLIRSQHVSL
jgi:putative transposase